MKLDALDHPKTINLAAQLGICLPQAIGHLELFWFFVGQKTPRGNVGRWSNAVIAYHAQWPGRPDDFVKALVDAGFVEEHSEHRLIVHDWKDHMPRWVKAKLAKEKKAVVSSDNSGNCRDDDSDNDSSDYSGDYSGDFKGREGKGREKKGKHTSNADASDGSIPDCPHLEIIQLYHQRLPMLSSVVESLWPGSAGAKNLAQRWKENEEHQDLVFWDSFFRVVAMNEWWVNPNKWGKANLRWLVKKENFIKVVEYWSNLENAA